MFKAVVDDPVMVGGTIVVPRGAQASLQAVHVEQSGTMKGSDKISLKLHSFRFGGNVYEVASSYVETAGKGEGKKTARKVGGGAGLGAIVGGIAGGGSGAAIGAAVGGVTGAAVASAGEEHLKLAAETRLQFQLTAAVSVRPYHVRPSSAPWERAGRAPRCHGAYQTFMTVLGRVSPSFAMRVSSVVGRNPSRSAAPPVPRTRQFAPSRILRM